MQRVMGSLVRCLSCGDAVREAHWLCARHRRERGRRVRGPIREAALLRALAFDFPICSRYDEFRARVLYAVDIWNSGTKVADIERAHGVALDVTGQMTTTERQSLLCAFVEFVCAHLHLAPASLAESCRDRVRAWYPELVCADSLPAILRGERMLIVLAAATGARDFLVYADLLVALAPVLDRDAIGLVYTSYAAGLHRGGA